MTSNGFAHPVPGASTNSGLYWFFSADNWEVLAKTINGCGINSHYWFYSAATTDQHYALVFGDTVRNTYKTYVNFVGNPAPAITDVNALATCP
jgi:hypothetical protein